jgi:hypothetical protein
MGLLRIRAAIALPDHRLRLTLSDGSVVVRDVSQLLTGPVFDTLRTKSTKFAEVVVRDGTVCWPDGADLCPDVLIWGGLPPEDEHARPPETLVLARDHGGCGPDSA